MCLVVWTVQGWQETVTEFFKRVSDVNKSAIIGQELKFRYILQYNLKICNKIWYYCWYEHTFAKNLILRHGYMYFNLDKTCDLVQATVGTHCRINRLFLSDSSSHALVISLTPGERCVLYCQHLYQYQFQGFPPPIIQWGIIVYCRHLFVGFRGLCSV